MCGVVLSGAKTNVPLLHTFLEILTSGTTLSGEVGPGLRRLHRAPRYCLHTVEAATHSLRDNARKGQGSVAWVAARGESGETCARGRKRASEVWESDENCLANEARLKLQIISHFNFFNIKFAM